MYLRDHQAVLFCTQQVELKRMADAAWFVDGCNVRHVECLAKVQLHWSHGTTTRKRRAVLLSAGAVGCIPSLSPNRASSRVAGTFELRTAWEILGESTVTVANTFLRQPWLVSPILDNCACDECIF